jgi:Tfp pilus assembly protein PilN
VIRINLLPPEITQKRKDEKNWRWVFAGGMALVCVLFAFFMAVWFQQTIREGEVLGVEQKAAMVEAQANQYRIFETKLADMQNRRAIADEALAQRIDWSRLFSELALVLPSDTYLTTLGGTEAETHVGQLSLGGLAADNGDESADTGYKTIAKLLVRLTELDQLQKVWLTGSTKQTQTDASGAPNISTIQWTVTADILAAPAPSTSAAPAPPTP